MASVEQTLKGPSLAFHSVQDPWTFEQAKERPEFQTNSMGIGDLTFFFFKEEMYCFSWEYQGNVIGYDLVIFEAEVHGGSLDCCVYF